jgi:hypothetical protein
MFLTGDLIGVAAELRFPAYQIQWVSGAGAWTIYNDGLTDHQGHLNLPGTGGPYTVPDGLAADAKGKSVMFPKNSCIAFAK